MQRQVMVEVRVPRSTPTEQVRELADELTDLGFDWDKEYMVPIPRSSGRGQYRYVLLRGRVEEGREASLQSRPDVVRIWSDEPVIKGFDLRSEEEKADDLESEDESSEVAPKSPFSFTF
jgi:hypothetical protein